MGCSEFKISRNREWEWELEQKSAWWTEGLSLERLRVRHIPTFAFGEQWSAEKLLLGRKKKKDTLNKEHEWFLREEPAHWFFLDGSCARICNGHESFACPAFIPLSFRTQLLLWGTTHLTLLIVWSIRKLWTEVLSSLGQGVRHLIHLSNRLTQRLNLAQVLPNTLKKLLAPKPWFLPRGKSLEMFSFLWVPAPVLPWFWFFLVTLDFIHYPISFL